MTHGVDEVDQQRPEDEREWVGGAPLDRRLAELAAAGMSHVDALLHLLEWAIRQRPLDEVELLLSAVEPEMPGMAPDVLADLRWLQGFAALRAGHYANALAVLAPLSQFDLFLDRPLGPQERGPQVLASMLVTQVYRELGARTAAAKEADRALNWLGDLGATDYESCGQTAGQLWKGAHLVGFELEIGLAEDAVTANDLDQASTHVVAARRWLPRRAFATGRDATVPWRHRLSLLLVWSQLALARGWQATARFNAESALELARRHQALPDLARCQYQLALAQLGVQVNPVTYLLDPTARPVIWDPMDFRYSLAEAAATAESAGLSELAVTVHFMTAALYAPHYRGLTRFHLTRALREANKIARNLSLALAPWWELSRMARLRLTHTIAHHDERWSLEASALHSDPLDEEDDDEGMERMPDVEDFPQPADLEGDVRTALRQAGFTLADEAGAGALLTPAPDQLGLLVTWQPSSELRRVAASISSSLVMRELARLLESLGFMARYYEHDPTKLIIKGAYNPVFDADDEDDGDRAMRWYRSETVARHRYLTWVVDNQIYDLKKVTEGAADHPMRALVLRILIALDDAGLPLQVEWPNEGYGTGIDVAVLPHDTDGGYVILSWEPHGNVGEYQREVFRMSARTMIERVLNAAGIVTTGQISDGSVYVFTRLQELNPDRPIPLATPEPEDYEDEDDPDGPDDGPTSSTRDSSGPDSS